jgi:protein-tyrosine phosphatase
VSLCRALVADGITTAVATPHQLGRYDLRNGGPDVLRAVAALRDVLAREGVPLVVLGGADVRVDERLPQLLEAGHVLTLGGGRHVLLELPHETYIEPLPLIRLLVARGLRPIVSHPERQEHVAKHTKLTLPWLQGSAALQVTAGSLAGDFGEAAERCAWDLLAAGSVAFVAGDAHGAKRRPPRMSAAIDLIERRLGRAVAWRVCIDNPARVLAAGAAGDGRVGATEQSVSAGGGPAATPRPGWGTDRGRRGRSENGTHESMVQHRIG